MRKGLFTSKLSLLLMTAALTGAAATASAAPNYLFFYTDNTNTALGSLSVCNGIATSGAITVTQGLDKGCYPLICNPSAPAPFNFDNALFMYDDLVFPAQTGKVDPYGLFFGANGLDLNIYLDTNSSKYSLLSYSSCLPGYNVQASDIGNFYLWCDAPSGICDLEAQVTSLVCGGVKLPDGGKAIDCTLNAAIWAASNKNSCQAIGDLNFFELEVVIDSIFCNSFTKVEAESLLAFAEELKYEIK